MIEYAALAGLPVPVRLAVSTAALPLEVAVTGVRLLKDVEALLAEVVVQLRSLRPAVAALGEAYAEEGVDQLLDTVDDLRAGSRAVAVVWSPFSAVRDVFAPRRVEPVPEPVPEVVPEPRVEIVAPAAEPAVVAEDPTPGEVGRVGRLAGGVLWPLRWIVPGPRSGGAPEGDG